MNVRQLFDTKSCPNTDHSMSYMEKFLGRHVWRQRTDHLLCHKNYTIPHCNYSFYFIHPVETDTYSQYCIFHSSQLRQSVSFANTTERSIHIPFAASQLLCYISVSEAEDLNHIVNNTLRSCDKCSISHLPQLQRATYSE